MSREQYLIRKISQKSGVPAPAFEGNSNVPAAYNPWKGKIFVSKALFLQLSDKDAENILAHEMGHVATKALVMFNTVFRAISLVAVVFLGLIAVLLIAAGTFVAIVPALVAVALGAANAWLNLHQEVLADRFAVKYSGDAAGYLDSLKAAVQLTRTAPSRQMKKRWELLDALTGIQMKA